MDADRSGRPARRGESTAVTGSPGAGQSYRPPAEAGEAPGDLSCPRPGAARPGLGHSGSMTGPLPDLPPDRVARMLDVAVAQAELGRDEGGVPIGAALFTLDGVLLGAGRNRRVQRSDPSVHAETDAF